MRTAPFDKNSNAVGSIAGEAGIYATSVFANCFHVNDVIKSVGSEASNPVTLKNVTALTDAQLRQQSSYTGFDFNTIWQMSSDYPTLRNVGAQTN